MDLLRDYYLGKHLLGLYLQGSVGPLAFYALLGDLLDSTLGLRLHLVLLLRGLLLVLRLLVKLLLLELPFLVDLLLELVVLLLELFLVLLLLDSNDFSLGAC